MIFMLVTIHRIVFTYTTTIGIRLQSQFYSILHYTYILHSSHPLLLDEPVSSPIGCWNYNQQTEI